MTETTLNSKKRAAVLTSEQSMRLIESARLAPSPDNNQPWCFSRDDSSVHVSHVRARALPSDIDDFFSWQAIGPAIENIVLAASAQQLAAEVQYQSRPFAETAAGELVATIRFSEGATPDPLADCIEQRTSNRKMYQKASLDNATMESLSSSIQDPECRLSWLTSAGDLKSLSGLVYIADRIRFEHRPFHDEFHKVLRYSESEAKRTGDGMGMKSLEIPSFAVPLMKWLQPWNRMKWANRFGMSGMFARNSIGQVRHSGGVGLLVTSRSGDEGYLEAGRALQRVWLAATRAGLAFQPLGGLPLFLTKLAAEGSEAFQPFHAKQLGGIVEPFQRLFPAAREARLGMMFRVGRAKPPSARSYRFEVNKILS